MFYGTCRGSCPCSMSNSKMIRICWFFQSQQNYCFCFGCSSPNGTFVAKIFRGRDVGLLYAQCRLLFDRVSVAKPTSSRNSSIEAFVVCQGFRGGEYMDLPLEGGFDTTVSRQVETLSDRDLSLQSVVPFLACGDLTGYVPPEMDYFDSDKSYPIEDPSLHLEPLAPPIRPPYEESKARAKEAKHCD